jgi:hypothetical protein
MINCRCDSICRTKVYFVISLLIGFVSLAVLIFCVVVVLKHISNDSEFAREVFYPIFLCLCAGIVGNFITLINQIFFYYSYRDYYNAYQAQFSRRVEQTIDDESLQGFAAIGRI